MPEYHQLQVGLPLVGQGAEVVRRFAAVLAVLEPQGTAAGWLRRAAFDPMLGAWTELGGQRPVVAWSAAGAGELRLEPHVLVPIDSVEAGEPWILCELLLWTEDIWADGPGGGGYRPEVAPSVLALAAALWRGLGATELFLTDEVTDGLPLQHLWEPGVAPEWSFDLGLLSLERRGRRPVPRALRSWRGEGVEVVYRADRWPWEPRLGSGP